MAAFKRNLRITAGDDFTKQFTHKIGDDPATATPFDFTGCTARLQVRQSINAAAAVDISTGSGITLGGAAGTIDILIPRAVTSTLAFKTGIWALEVTLADGLVRTLIEGQVTVLPEIVR